METKLDTAQLIAWVAATQGVEIDEAIAALMRTEMEIPLSRALPALGVPCGFSSGGLPVGAQLIGKPFGEARLLRVGHAFQRATDWHRRLPPDIG